MKGALTRYRVMAYVVGVMLLVLVCVAMPIRYILRLTFCVKFSSGMFGKIRPPLDLAIKARWNFWTTVGLLLSGAVPFLSFYMERRVTKQVQERFLQPAGAGSQVGQTLVDSAAVRAISFTGSVDVGRRIIATVAAPKVRPATMVSRGTGATRRCSACSSWGMECSPCWAVCCWGRPGRHWGCWR